MPNAPAYARMLMQLFPRGGLFNREVGSGLSKLTLAMGEELARVEARSLALVEEADPRTATETLELWERMLGLPDEAVPVIPATVELRRLAIVSKFVGGAGGQSRAFFIGLAKTCGYDCSIYEFGKDVLRAGFQAEAPAYELPWAHAWRLDVQPPTGPALSQDNLERIIRRATPAHTAVIFNYL
ncbi:putative phage tail protein [Archangium violaceum]|uniref:putative phage tail protein n=1 Tax=Archangium violaceum TaxID=83451 RepID=UPI0036D87536